MKILIVGGGVAGLAFAGFLEKKQIANYILIEKDAEWNRRGFSMGMWSMGQRILAKLNLADTFDASGVINNKMFIKSESGKLLKFVDLSEVQSRHGVSCSNIRRQDLRHWLLSKINSEKLKMNTVITNLKVKKNGVQVTFNDRSSDTFDLVVGADGIRSDVRKKNFKDPLEQYTNWRLWFIPPLKKIVEQNTVIEYVKPKGFIGILDDGRNGLMFVCSQVKQSIPDTETGRISRIKTLFPEPFVGQALEGLSDGDVLSTDLAQVNIRTWHRNRLVLIGDAAHGFESFGGLGASMALEDAYVLAEELSSVSNDYTLDSALDAYEHRRKKRVDKARRVTKKMRAWSVVESPFWRSLINLFAPVIPSKFFLKDFINLMNERV